MGRAGNVSGVLRPASSLNSSLKPTKGRGGKSGQERLSTPAEDTAPCSCENRTQEVGGSNPPSSIDSNLLQTGTIAFGALV
jgi:hypothetical protein